MKAAVLHQSGSIPRCEDFPDPTPGENEQVVSVKAASIKNIDKMMAMGSHYSVYHQFPLVVGLDGVGTLPNGSRIYTGGIPPYGLMAQKSLIKKGYSVRVPDGLDDITAAAIPNPAVSAWLSLNWRGQMKKGDTVFILGATGVTGKLAIQIAKEMGAGKIIAAGRNEKRLQLLKQLGADQLISLSSPIPEIRDELLNTVKKNQFDLVLDYLWGQPAELLLDLLTGHDLHAKAHSTRYIQIGEMAGAKINLAAATLRSAGVELYGQGGGSIPKELLAKIPTEIIPMVFNMAAEGKISIETETFPLCDIELAWQKEYGEGKRLVILP